MPSESKSFLVDQGEVHMIGSRRAGTGKGQDFTVMVIEETLIAMTAVFGVHLQ